VARIQEKLTEEYLDLEEETSKLGMEINENKTKYMVTSTYEHRRNAGDLQIGNKTFEAVQSFQYLVNTIGNTNSNYKYSAATRFLKKAYPTWSCLFNDVN
jgi:hypothetical protein